MRLQLQIGLTAALLASAGSTQAQTRFQNMDSDNDGVITRAEWRGNAQSFPGRQDWVGYQRFDLDGQRELERADSGYAPKIGSLSDYQAGYREGFREAYREGFDAARGSR